MDHFNSISKYFWPAAIPFEDDVVCMDARVLFPSLNASHRDVDRRKE